MATEAVGSDWKFTVQKGNKNNVLPYDIIQEDPKGALIKQ